jgi:hypothetical protein
VSELLFVKTPNGLAPYGEEASEWLRKKKLGTTIEVSARELRNGGLHRKWFSLVSLAYDYWKDDAETVEYKGERVQPNFDRFRKDVTIAAGFFDPVVNLKGELRLEPKSLKWSQMDEERFTKLYDATIQVLLQRVFNGKVCRTMSEDELRSIAEQITEYAA